MKTLIRESLQRPYTTLSDIYKPSGDPIKVYRVTYQVDEYEGGNQTIHGTIHAPGIGAYNSDRPFNISCYAYNQATQTNCEMKLVGLELTVVERNQAKFIAHRRVNIANWDSVIL